MAVPASHVAGEMALADLNPRSAVHVLNRLGYGPRPGDVDRLLARGVDRYVEDQLDPRPDPGLEARLAAFPYLGWTMAEAWARQQDDLRTGRPDSREPRTTYINTLNTQLQWAQLVRAAHSTNQLLERMTWFWFNHFNVNLPDDYVRYSAHDYEKQLRRHALGRFKDLLSASAHHPAMMSYLDNYVSTVSRYNNQGRLVSGLNENYGRELLELHTLGVAAGYSQDHVYNAAIVLTGWGLDRAQGRFLFTPGNHDARATEVFGHQVPAGLMQEGGEGLLDHLARHPKTAEHISFKLVRYFVADDPPAGLVQRAADTFRATDGDVREVLRTIFRSHEFWAQALGAGRPKDPVSYVVGMLRAVDADVVDGRLLVGTLNGLGQPPYQCVPPTGWSLLCREWDNPSSLLRRMNFTLDLVSAPASSGSTRGLAVDVETLLRRHGVEPKRDAVAAFFNREVLGGRLGTATLAALRGLEPSGPVPLAARVAGLVLAGPEAQRG